MSPKFTRFISFLSLITLLMVFSCARNYQPYTHPMGIKAKERKRPAASKLREESVALKIGLAPLVFEYGSQQDQILDEQKIAQLSQQGMEVLNNYLKQDPRFFTIEDPSLNKLKKVWEKSDLAHLKYKYDYILLGSIKNFGKRVLKTTKKVMAYSKVEFKLININTRKVVYKEYGDSQLSLPLGESSDHRYLEDQVLQQSILALAPKIQDQLSQTPWKGLITEGYSENGEDFLVINSEKSQGLEVKQVLEIVMVNTDFKNPITRTQLTMIGRPLGLAEITDFIPGKPGEGKTICKVLGDQLRPHIQSQNFAHIFLRPVH